MVAMVCPEKGEIMKHFQNKFLATSGKWETDYGVKATCKTEKLDVLEYCKQVYPALKITNIIQSTKYQKIDRWCRTGNLKCRGPARWVKPYRCIEATPSTPASTVSTTTTDKMLLPKADKEDEYYYDDDDYLEEEDDDDDYYEDDDDDDEDDDEYDEDDYDDDDLYEDDELLSRIDT